MGEWKFLKSAAPGTAMVELLAEGLMLIFSQKLPLYFVPCFETGFWCVLLGWDGMVDGDT